MERLLAVGGITVVALAAALMCMLLFKIKQARRTSKSHQCFYCGNSAVRLSAPSGPVDWLLGNWNCAPHRCEVCFRRYYRFVREF